MTMFDYATNAACPERSSWKIAEVDYSWAKEVFKDYKNNKADRFQKRNACKRTKDTFQNRNARPLGWQTYYSKG